MKVEYHTITQPLQIVVIMTDIIYFYHCLKSNNNFVYEPHNSHSRSRAMFDIDLFPIIYLDLQHNRLKSFICSRNKSIYSIFRDLRYNRISSIGNGTFKNLSQLQHLLVLFNCTE